MILCPLPLARTSPGRTPNAEPAGVGGPTPGGAHPIGTTARPLRPLGKLYQIAETSTHPRDRPRLKQTPIPLNNCTFLGWVVPEGRCSMSQGLRVLVLFPLFPPPYGARASYFPSSRRPTVCGTEPLSR